MLPDTFILERRQALNPQNSKHQEIPATEKHFKENWSIGQFGKSRRVALSVGWHCQWGVTGRGILSLSKTRIQRVNKKKVEDKAQVRGWLCKGKRVRTVAGPGTLSLCSWSRGDSMVAGLGEAQVVGGAQCMVLSEPRSRGELYPRAFAGFQAREDVRSLRAHCIYWVF